MAESIDLNESALVAITRDSLSALRAALFRDVGPSAAALLQEAGFAGGPALYAAFGRWLASRRLPEPEFLAAEEFGTRASEFFRDAGWGSVSIGELSSVMTLDSSDWAEGNPDYPLDFPGCYYTAGAFAEFFGRVAGEPVAVMEVECRSMGAERCRFLVGGTEIMQRVYDAMGEGIAYDQAVAAGA
jgi:predicted hydrocarbon binding protein